ncbi:MAG: hypothetical protein ACK4FP_07330 [Azonexus sp.]
MTLTERDLRKLALPILIALALFGTAGALAWWTQENTRQAGLERQRAAEAKSRLEQRLRQFHSEELDLKTRLQSLQRLQGSGILGDEQRLDWLEQLRDTQRALRLPGMKYEFAAQTPLPGNIPGGPAWFNSPLRLQLRLVHEGDLLDFLDRIQQQAKALVIVRSCKLAPPSGPTERPDTPTGLTAECELDWLTARLPNQMH